MKKIKVEKTIDKLVGALKQAEKLLVVIHVSPDGDTLGSSLALGLGLAALGKRVTCVCQDAPPPLYNFLPGALSVRKPAQIATQDFDTSVAVDVADSLRMGNVAPLYNACPVRLVIDHHGTNDRFGQINWIDENFSAVGAQIYTLLRRLGVPITEDIATLLYTAICTDTGNFNYGNTNGQALRVAADMLDAGVDANTLTERIYRTRSRAGVMLLGRALSTLTFYAQCSVAMMCLRKSDFEETEATESMTEGIVNYAIEIQGVKAACLARETEEGIKCSLRSIEPYDVAEVAQQLGGGGHPQASGMTMREPLERAMAIVQDMLCRL